MLGSQASDTAEGENQLALEIFRRDLNEVHLLMDFISSLPGKGLDDLSLPDPEWKPTAVNQSRPHMDPAATVARISLIRFPPSPNPETRAADAAVLLLAKDRLNDLARPARGHSIAYTTMFSSGIPLWRGSRNPSRYDLALGAYPEAVRNVRLFRLLYLLLLAFGLLWLVLTGFSYWDVALGTSILRNMSAIETERDNFYRANPNLLGCPGTGTVGNGEARGVAPAENQRDPVSCRRLEQLLANETAAAEELTKYGDCAGGWQQFLVVRCWPAPQPFGAARPLRSRETPDPARAGLPVQGASGGPAAVPPGNLPAVTTQQLGLANASNVATTLAVFGTYIVPVMFGVLGTLVAAFRSVHDQVRDSLLSPRDALLLLTNVPIGAIAGLAVGLFFRVSDGTVTGLSGLPSTVSLSVAGLAFLTGYAADAFFSFLDSIRSQVFRATNPPPGSDAAAYRTAAVSPSVGTRDLIASPQTRMQVLAPADAAPGASAIAPGSAPS